MAEKSNLEKILNLKNDEEFKIKGYNSTFRFHDGRRQYKFCGEWSWTDNEKALLEIINDPSLVIREPRFSDEEMTVLRWLHKHAQLKRIYKTIDGHIGATSYGMYSTDGNIADCLLKPGETIDLDEMFKEDEMNGKAKDIIDILSAVATAPPECERCVSFCAEARISCECRGDFHPNDCEHSLSYKEDENG